MNVPPSSFSSEDSTRSSIVSSSPGAGLASSAGVAKSSLNKRSYEDHSGSGELGAGMMSYTTAYNGMAGGGLGEGGQAGEFGNTAKRQQTEAAPSRVLLMRNLARGVTENDIKLFVKPFTSTFEPKIYLQSSAGHAFIEFQDEQAATEALTYFRKTPIMLQGSPVQVSFSKRESVTTMEEKADPYRVVLASVTNLLYPVDISLMYYLFSKYGTVEKIITFTKSPTMYQALVQFNSDSEARTALQTLHNRNIYDGCNTLQIQPSRM
eukprot:GHVT01004270.1.p1 GENE.GHVT01004270.1~~GHVT01004270.1.p1  ORF type:complete len:265 (+),score=49.52 GHVT01004270.1:206-1000(+)